MPIEAESGRDIVADTHGIHEHGQGGVEKTVRSSGAASVADWPMVVDRDGSAIAVDAQLLRVERTPAPALLAA